jgi:cysteinyl-tRNA synthetase
VRNLRWARTTGGPGAGAPVAEREALESALVDARTAFEADMDDDFNTAGALGAVFELARQANSFLGPNQATLSVADRAVLASAEAEMVELLSVMGVTLQPGASVARYPGEVVGLAAQLAGYAGSDPAEAVEALLAARAAARSERNWAAADIVRDGLGRLGFVVEDTPAGARVVFEGGD